MPSAADVPAPTAARAHGRPAGTLVPDPVNVAGAYPREAVTAVILAGGRGSRMGGVDKGLVEIAGRPMVEHVLAAVEPQAAAVVINANRSNELYGRYGHPVIADRLDGFQGPLAGMASALASAGTEFVLAVPCDSPLVTRALGPRLHAALEGKNANVAVAHDGERMHPVFVLLRRAARPGLEDFLTRGERKIDRWFAEEATVVVDFSDLPEMFLNVNREADRSRLESRLASARPAAHAILEPQHRTAAASVDASDGNETGDFGSSPEAATERPPGSVPLPDRRRPPVVGFAGYSGSGKTTLATAVVRSLAGAGVRVAAVKHAHHSFDIDRPGKDSYELRRAGAVQTLVGSRQRWALVSETRSEREPTLCELVDRLDWDAIDIVLVEGFKHGKFPKIAVGRGEARSIVDDSFVVAVATPGATGPARAGERTLPQLDLDRPDLVARFIVERFLTP